MSTSNRTPLSGAWRIDPSSILPIDLANALRSVRKVIGSVSDREVSVSFASSADQTSAYVHDTMQIIMNPKFATKSSPIEAEDFDVLAGEGVHEALHVFCRSPEVIPPASFREVRDPSVFASVCRIGEEVYIDNFGKRNYAVLGKYIHRAREAYKSEDSEVDWSDLFNTWAAISVYGVTPTEAAFEGNKRLAQIKVLMELTEKLSGQDLEARLRRQLYQEVADKLDAYEAQAKIEEKLSPETMEMEGEHITNTKMPGPNKGDESDNTETQDGGDGVAKPDDDKDKENGKGASSKTNDDSDEGEEDEQQGGSSGGSDVGNSSMVVGENVNKVQDIVASLHPEIEPLPKALQHEVEEALANETQDITDQLEEDFSGITDGRDVIWRNASTNPDPEFNQKLANQLAWIKEYKNTTGKQTYRNEPRGRIDPLKIHKAPINGLIFKVKKELPKSNLDLVLLLDASTSMRDQLQLYEDAKALFKALPDSTVLSYGRDGPVTINKHTQGRVFRGIKIRGDTPSGIALAATATKYPKSLIIHFTDGESNVGEHPNRIIPQIHEKYPKVKIINIYLKDQSKPIMEFPGVSRSIGLNNIHEFPEKLKEVLKVWR